MDERQHKELCLWIAKLITVYISGEYHRLGVCTTEEYLENLGRMVDSIDTDIALILGIPAGEEAAENED